MRDAEAALTAAIIAFATEYGRYGYRRIAAMLRDAINSDPKVGPINSDGALRLDQNRTAHFDHGSNGIRSSSLPRTPTI